MSEGVERGAGASDDVLAVFEHVDGPAITSRDVAIVLGCSRAEARRQLADLHKQGAVRRRKSGSVVLWWRPDADGQPSVTGDLSPVDMGETNAVEVIEANPDPDEIE
jgi:hypothetical protein